MENRSEAYREAYNAITALDTKRFDPNIPWIDRPIFPAKPINPYTINEERQAFIDWNAGEAAGVREQRWLATVGPMDELVRLFR